MLKNEVIINVFWSDANNGYQYDIFENEQKMEDGESLDGGLCTSNLFNAIEMATSQAQALIESEGDEKKELFPYEFKATQIHFGNVEIEAESQAEADEKAKQLIEECNGGSYADEIKWTIEESNYTCEKFEEKSQEQLDKLQKTPKKLVNGKCPICGHEEFTATEKIFHRAWIDKENPEELGMKGGEAGGVDEVECDHCGQVIDIDDLQLEFY